MLFVVLAFVVYNNLLNLGQGWMNAGLIGFGSLLVLLHGGVLLLGLAWLAKRHTHWTLRLGPRQQASQPLPAVRANPGSPA